MPAHMLMDTTVPNSARVYDYVLGGYHNFEADRQAAEYMISLVPSTRKWVRMLRMFMQFAVEQLAGEGFDCFLDLASGLPTVEHIHSTVPDAHVIYVDSDPVVVAYGTEILGDNPRVRYLQADVREINSILTSPIVKTLFGGMQRSAIGFNAITVFLTDAEIRAIMQRLYEWAAPGSKLFITIETKNPNLMTPKMQQFVDMFAQMETPYRFTTVPATLELVKPWVPDRSGFRPLADWLGVQNQITDADREGVELEFYGAFLVRQ